MNDTNSGRIMRSALGRARGYGSARSGVHHWRAQRVTAIALLPLALYFVLSVLILKGADQAAMLAYMHEPWNAVLFLALIASIFYHLQLGLQVIIEDYIHAEGRRIVLLLVARGSVVFFGLLAAISVLKLAL